MWIKCNLTEVVEDDKEACECSVSLDYLTCTGPVMDVRSIQFGDASWCYFDDGTACRWSPILAKCTLTRCTLCNQPMVGDLAGLWH